MEDLIRKQLIELADEKYRSFSASLLPNVDNILGVRLPELRKIAKQIVKGDWREYLKTAKVEYFEEIMLQGIVIGCAKTEVYERLSYIEKFIPLINNWSVCDSFCAGLKFTKQNEDIVWLFLQKYLISDVEYEIRFGVVMLLDFYVKQEYLQAAFEKFDNIKHEGYYVKMAVAWAVSIYYIKFPNETMEYLLNNRLDDFTYNKALQKITESLRVDKATKEIIKNMKRK
jgi:3-methyladenine DNA glycosylase AlkD